jgi:hypothetical protein
VADDAPRTVDIILVCKLPVDYEAFAVLSLGNTHAVAMTQTLTSGPVGLSVEFSARMKVLEPLLSVEGTVAPPVLLFLISLPYSFPGRLEARRVNIRGPASHLVSCNFATHAGRLFNRASPGLKIATSCEAPM